MDLWIRTQKRLDIFKVNNVQIMGCDIYTYTADGNYTLGEYDSTDRALEVLDEIQKLITPQIVSLLNNIKEGKNYNLNELTNVYAYSLGLPKPELEIKELSTVVYEMPKE